MEPLPLVSSLDNSLPRDLDDGDSRIIMPRSFAELSPSGRIEPMRIVPYARHDGDA